MDKKSSPEPTHRRITGTPGERTQKRPASRADAPAGAVGHPGASGEIGFSSQRYVELSPRQRLTGSGNWCDADSGSQDFFAAMAASPYRRPVHGASPSNPTIPAKFEELGDAMRDPGKEPWRACLLRIDSPSGHLSIDFEYDHPEKSLINPATARKMPESLRPAG
jgi:hypothetical protein